MLAPGFWRENWLACALLMAVPFALYWKACTFGYCLDDQLIIWDNMYVQKGFAGLAGIFQYDSFMGFFKEQKFLLEGGRYRPLSLATFAVEVGFFGKDHPQISHFINCILYGLNGILLFRILLGLFPKLDGGKWFFSLAFLASFVFLMHPLHVECVANIKGRDEILALMGSLGALYGTLKFFDTERRVWLWAAFASLLLGLLAKENSLTFVVVVPITLWFCTKIPLNRILAKALPALLAAAAVFMLIRFRALGFVMNHGIQNNDLMNDAFYGMTGSERLATIFLTLGWYLKLLVWPTPLTHDYYPYHVPKVNWSEVKSLISLALYVGGTAWAVWQLRRARTTDDGQNTQTSKHETSSSANIWAWAVLYFVLTTSIISNIFVSVGVFMGERFMYMPSVAVCVLVGWMLARFLPKIFGSAGDRPYLLGIGLALIITGLAAVRVWTRVPDWRNGYWLNKSAAENSPGSARAHCFYVTGIYENYYTKTKDNLLRAPMVDTMEWHIERALEINPNYSAAWQMKAAVAAGRFEQDHQMDKLFHVWEICFDHIPYNAQFRSFISQYLKYLQGRSNANKMNTFCYRIGYEYYYKQKNDLKTAVEYLEYGEATKTDDPRLLEALGELYEKTGQAAKAADCRARAAASKKW